MSLTNEMYRTIVDHPQQEMTIDEIIRSMAVKLSNGFNPHTIRVNMSKMATKGFLIEKTGKRKGRAKVYKKREDIQQQWHNRQEGKSTAGALTETRVQAETGRTRRKTPVDRYQNKYQMVGEMVADLLQRMEDQHLVLAKISDLNKRLDRIEKILQSQAESLADVKDKKPFVVVRREKRDAD